MKSTLVSAIVGLPLLSLASASGTIQLDLKRDGGASPALRKRASNTVQADLSESSSLVQYFVTVAMGTPPQSLELILDTGSSDVWAVASDALVDPADGAGTSGGTCNNSHIQANFGVAIFRFAMMLIFL